MKTGLFFLLLCVAAPAALFLLHRAPDAAKGGEGKAVRPVLTETDWNDYQWPTDASTKRTSCFCEFRANHFHAGIDASTNMQTGYNVFASRAGWVRSVSFEPNGYGWIITLQQPDGYQTLYAHLKGFPAKILAAYRAKLIATGHSYGLAEFTSNEVPVKKGEVVAYTGDTGAGPPHLHFEVRDKDGNPVNPGLAKHLRPVDSIAPEIKQLCFMPMDALSTVNGSSEPYIVTVSGSGRAYKLASVPVLRGRVGVLARAHDRANSAEDYPTPYLLEMKVDGKPYFESRFDRIQDKLGWHIRIDRDHWLMKGMKGEFRKLYREEGNALWVYHAETGDDGVFVGSSMQGKHRVTIHAADESGNSSALNFDVQCGPYDAPTVSTAPEPRAGKRKTAAVATLCAAREFRYDEIVYTIRTGSKPSALPSLEVEQGATKRSATVIQEAPTRFRAVLRAWEGFAGKATATITVDLGGKKETWTDSFTATLISARKGGTLASDDGAFSMRFDANDVYRSMLCWVTKDIKEGRTVWHAYPDDVPIAGKPVVSFKQDEAAARYGFIRAFHPFVFLRATRDDKAADKGRVEAAVGRLLGEYTLREDRTGPSIDGGAGGRGAGPFRFRVLDSLSGVLPRSIVVKAGDAVVPVEYSEGQKVYYVPTDVWRSLRASIITVSATDVLGNRTSREFRGK